MLTYGHTYTQCWAVSVFMLLKMVFHIPQYFDQVQCLLLYLATITAV